MRTGIASFTLDYGKCPPWLFEKMVKLARVIGIAIIEEFGTEEFLTRMSDPVWFQSFGCVLAFDWNASGLTTTTLGAIKEAFRGIEKELGVFVCGGKGKTSRKTPDQIRFWSGRIGFGGGETEGLVYASKAAAKVDSALIQDGFELYHHSFLFNNKGKWAVIQQGMNTSTLRARRYHWLGQGIRDFIEEPHSGIASQVFLPKVLDLTDSRSKSNRDTSMDLIANPQTLLSDVKILAEKFNPQKTFKILDLPGVEFHHHPVANVDFASPRLQKPLKQLLSAKPTEFEKALMTPGVGGKTIRAISLVAEIIYGAKPSYEDPARYTFAHGGKDGTPYPVDRTTYDKTLQIMERAIKASSKLGVSEKNSALKQAEKQFSR